MEPSAFVHMRGSGIWPMIISSVSWTLVPGVNIPNSPASMATASKRHGYVIRTMTVAMAVMSWKLSVVSQPVGAHGVFVPSVWHRILLCLNGFEICAHVFC